MRDVGPPVVKGAGLGRMRKQYHFWPGSTGVDAWDVGRLVALSRALPVKQVPLSNIWELDTLYWGESLTVRQVAEHMALVNEVDPTFPIILGSDGRVMDGMHRVVRAVIEGRTTLDAVQFDVTPPPDFVDCVPAELPLTDQ
jgi:hypothetical protein